MSVRVEPLELRFSAILEKQTSSLQISNDTENYIAFKVKATDPVKYNVVPNAGVLLPRSTRHLVVEMREQIEFSPDMQCKDKFLIQSFITNATTTEKIVTSDMIRKLGNIVRECKLRVVYDSTRQHRLPSSRGESISNNNPKADKRAGFLLSGAKSEPVVKLLHKLAREKPRQFSQKDLIGFTSNLTTKLGSGAFGNVYKGQFVDGVEIAVKVLVENEVVEEEFMAEVSTMGRTYHCNLVKLYGFCFEDNMKALAYEHASNGSLDKVLYENRFNLKWEKLYDIAVGTSKGLLYLHDGCYPKIIHYDIKPANVLLDSHFSPMITDFGLARLMSRDVNYFIMTSIRGTPGFAAPETFIQASEITYKCDVYSFGMMLFEILGRRKNATSEAWFAKQVWEKFEKGELDELIQDCGITGENKEKARILSYVALWCIQHTPETRPSFQQCSRMKYMSQHLPIPFILPLVSIQCNHLEVQMFLPHEMYECGLVIYTACEILITFT